MKKITLLLAAVLVCCFVYAPLAGAAPVNNKQAVLTQARQSYYNMKGKGFTGFQCTLTPDWEQLLKPERQQNPEGADAAIQKLRQLHFIVTLADDGSVTLTHNELAVDNQQMQDALKQIYGGMEQMTTGFFATWELFTFGPPFPEDDIEFQLEANGPQYVLTYADGSTNLETTMGKDFSISNLKVTTPQYTSSIQPSFSAGPDGFLLNAYTQEPGGTTHLKVLMDYQDIQGLKILNHVNLSGTDDGSPFTVNLTFSDCTVTKK